MSWNFGLLSSRPKRDLDTEAKADRRRKSGQTLFRGLARAQDQRRDPGGISRASMHGQLRGRAVTLADKARRIGQRVVAENLYKIAQYDHDSWLLSTGPICATNALECLAMIEVDASGVDLSDLNLHEPDAARGVIWTGYTKWPASIADEMRARKRTIRPEVYQVS